jgi:hypothetical protein
MSPPTITGSNPARPDAPRSCSTLRSEIVAQLLGRFVFGFILPRIILTLARATALGVADEILVARSGRYHEYVTWVTDGGTN